MTDYQMIVRIVGCMAAAMLAAVLIVVGILTGESAWTAGALVPAVAGLVAIGSVLRVVLRSERGQR